MPSNYNLPRQARTQPRVQTGNTSRYDLQRQVPLTQGAALAEQQNNKGLATGQFSDVQSAQGATDRANALRTSQSLQAARGTVARAGDFSPEAALRAQDQAFAASSAQNLNATNSVNQLQRQYRTDAQNRAMDFESQAQASANNERNYQTSRDDTEYGRNTDESRYADSRSDVAYGQAEDKRRYDQGFDANRQDTAWNQGMQTQQFGANREDAAWNKDFQSSQAADDRSRFDATRQDNRADTAWNQGFQKEQFGANREDAAWNKDFQTTQAADDRSRFDATRQDNRQDTAWNQNFQTGQAADSRNRYDLSRGDALQQQGVDNQYRDKVFNTQTGQWEQSFAANRSDTAWNQQNTVAQQQDDRSRFDLTRQDTNEQRGLDNQYRDMVFNTQTGQWERQFASNESQLGFENDFRRTEFADSRNRYDLSRQDSNDQFSVTSGQNQQQINNQVDQFGRSLDQNQNQFNVTSGQNQQQINNQASQFGQTFNANRQDTAWNQNYQTTQAADDRNRYDLSRGDNLQQQTVDNTYRDKVYSSENNKWDISRNDGLQQQSFDNSYRTQVLQDSQLDTQYNRSEAQRLEGKGDSLAAINSIQDPKAKQAAYNAYMNGEDVSQFITGKLYDSSGGLNQNYASADPGTQAYQAKISELRSYYPGKSDAELQQMASDERLQDRTISRQPIEQATKTQATAEAAERFARGTPTAADFDTLPSVNPASIPLGTSATNQWLASNTTGGWTKINGTAYKVSAAPNDGTFKYAILQDQNGGWAYLRADGSILPTATKPK